LEDILLAEASTGKKAGKIVLGIIIIVLGIILIIVGMMYIF